jgi:hypothetical protein
MVSATQNHWAGLLKAENDRSAGIKDAHQKELAVLKEDLQRLEDQRREDQRAWDAEKADLEERREKAQTQREEAVRRIEAEKALLNRRTTEVNVECSCMGQTVLDHLESGWDGVSDQWGHQFREILDIIKARLRPATSGVELEAMQRSLIQEYSKLGHPIVEVSDKVFQDPGSLDATQKNLSRSAPQCVRKTVYGLAANATALARAHRRRKEQRTQRSERFCNDFDPSWQVSAHSDSGCEPVTLSANAVLDARAVALKGIRFCAMPPHLGGPSQQASTSSGAVVLPPLSPK